MKPFTTLRIFHGNCCIVHPTVLNLKKIVLQEYILTITHKTQSFLLFSASSHTSSLRQKFKALHTEEEKREWDRSESENERDWKRRRQEQPWHSRIGNGSVSCWKSPEGATEIHQCPECLASWGLWGTRNSSWAGSQPAAQHSSQGRRAQHRERAGNKTSSRHRTGAALRGPAALMDWHRAGQGKRGRRCPAGNCQLDVGF